MITYITEEELRAELSLGEGARAFELAKDVASKYVVRYGERANAGSPDEGSTGPVRATDLGIAMLCSLTHRVGLDAQDTLKLFAGYGNAFNDLVADAIIEALARSWRPTYLGQSISLLAAIASNAPLENAITMQDIKGWVSAPLDGPYIRRWELALGSRANRAIELQFAFRTLRSSRVLLPAQNDSIRDSQAWVLSPWSRTLSAIKQVEKLANYNDGGL